MFQIIRKKIKEYKIKIYFYQILRGLAYMETLGIAHRDIKPQNILLNHRTNQIVICDFGSAKQIIKGNTKLIYRIKEFGLYLLQML